MIAFVIAAVAGGTWYGLAPGVASYQIGLVLILPLALVVLFWLHRRLPTRVQWVVAIALAAGGALGYLVYGGSQWWAWGQAAVLPFVSLAIARSIARGTAPGAREPWYGGHIEGPWGPP
jgi:hypothetical protein